MTVFDAAYYGTCAVLALALAAVAVWSVRYRKRISEPAGRACATALGLAAAGSELALVGGVSLSAIAPETGDLFYQRAHFAIFDVAFATILFGVVRLTAATVPEDPRRALIRLRGVWVGAVYTSFAVAITASGIALAVAGGPSIGGATQHVPQQTVFYLPVFLGLGYCAVIPLSLAITATRVWRRLTLVWFAMSAGLVLFGFLREANVIESSGQPMLDLLMAFGPFGLGSICLCLSVRACARGMPLVRL